jgi:hypothetical protein
MSENSDSKTHDAQIAGIKRAFDAAFSRLCAARSTEEKDAELSNVLAQFYRLSELCKHRLGEKQYHKILESTSQFRTARAIVWARTFDAHDVVIVAELGDRMSNYMTEMFGVPTWRALHELPQQIDKYGRHTDYQTDLKIDYAAVVAGAACTVTA